MAECAHCQAELPENGAACPHCGKPSLAEPDDLIGSSVLGRYRIVRLLAEGGMGRVYLAEQAVGTVVRRVAIKVLRKQLGLDRQLVARFSREAETLVRLTHPNTVQLFDFGALSDGTLALVMEYVEGHSLAHELLRGALSAPRAERVLSQVCGALQEAHAHGIVHRDLKPENLLIADRVGHGDFIKVLDFGIAKVSAEDPAAANTKLTQQGMMIGTPPYMSPEQFSGEPVDARSDIYSLGVIAFELLTGKLPFAAKTPWEWASKHLTTQPEELPIDGANGLGASHALAIRTALAKRASDRPQTVAEFLDVFTGRGFPAGSVPTLSDRRSRLEDPPAPPQPLVPGPRTPAASHAASTHTGSTETRSRSRRAIFLAGTIGVAVLIGVLVVLARGSRGAVSDRTAAPVARLPSPPASAPSEPASAPPVLPVGAGLPSEPKHLVRATPREPHATVERGATPRRELAHQGSAGARRESPPAAAVEPAPVEQESSTTAPRATTSRSATPSSTVPPSTSSLRSRAEEPRASTTAPTGSETSVPRAGAISPDLQQRVEQIRAASSSRVETAVGLYQAAANRYGSAGPLTAVRAELARAGEKRISELLQAGRCAQAQALYRALRATGATLQAGSGFGPGCPRP